MDPVVLVLILLCGLMPIGAIVCFRIAWNSEQTPQHVPVKVMLALPITVYPVLLLSLHAATSQPDWKEFGDGVFRYMAKGEAAWLYYPVFVAANFMVAFAIVKKDFAGNSVLTPLSLLTCLMTCLLFAAGNIESPLCFFPLSASCGYAYGLFLLVRSGGVLALVKQHYFLLVGWLASIVLTVLVSIARTREIVAGLPDSPPQDCFIVTAAARGHHAIVGSCIDRATGRLTNDQLASFRAFEDWLIAHTPRLHRAARSVYNVIAPPIARSIIFRWQADLVYLLLKPLEWLVRFVR